MPWVRLDDHFDENPKLAAVGPLGLALWVTGLAYCNRNLTDGFIPRRVAHTLLCFDGIGTFNGMQGEDASCERVALQLVETGLWEQDGRDYRIHDYLEYQPSKADVLAERALKAEAGSKGGQTAWRNRRARAIAPALAPATAPAIAELKPVPGPGPVPGPVPGEITKTAGADAPGAAAPRSPNGKTRVPAETEPRKTPAHAEQFTAVAEACGYDLAHLPRPARGEINAAAKFFDEAGWSADDIAAAGREYRRRMPSCELTPSALVKHGARIRAPSAATDWDARSAELDAARERGELDLRPKGRYAPDSDADVPWHARLKVPAAGGDP